MANRAEKSRMKSKSMQMNRMKLKEGEASLRPEVRGAARAETQVTVEVVVKPLLLSVPRPVIDDVDVVATSSSSAGDEVSVGGLLVPFPIKASDSRSKLSPLSREWEE